MTLIACGINHKTASLDLREKAYFPPEKATLILKNLLENKHAKEAVILSTCNRTEIYCKGERHEPILGVLAQHSDFVPEALKPHSYALYEEAAVAHAIRVASGLDSMVLGEPQILGQLKTAVKLAEYEGACRRQLKPLFRHVFSAAKMVRNTTQLGYRPITFAYAMTFLAKRIFAEISHLNVLLIGAGDIIRDVARHFYTQKVHQLWITNRTFSKAQALSQKNHAIAIPFSQILDYLPQADIVVCATGSPIPILGKGAVESALKKRKHRPIFMVDLAVPRNIEPEIDTLEDIYLYTIDHLKNILQENLSERLAAAQDAEKIVDIQTARFMRYLQSLSAVDTIKAFRLKVQTMYEQELQWSLKKLQTGLLPEEVLTQMGQRMANKFMHDLSVKLRQAGAEGSFEVLEQLEQLFNISNPPALRAPPFFGQHSRNVNRP